MTRTALTFFALGTVLSAGVAAGCGDDAPPGADCIYGGMSYSAGDSFPSTDGCNTCMCAAGGDVQCTLRACVDGGGGDSSVTTDSGTPPTDGGGGPCSTDSECAEGSEWCEGGNCVPCDNGGLLCDIACEAGWDTYMRNGCSPCACAPTNDCVADNECEVGPAAGKCYAGAFCWDWCPAGDPSCCFGNVCSVPGCDTPPPVACTVRGCPIGQECAAGGPGGPSSCMCNGAGDWGCTRDLIMRSCM